MIISKTPYRISLFGGGTDLPVYFKKYQGLVIGFAINKYSYLFFKETKNILNYKYRIVYSKQEICNSLSKISHPSARETLKYYGFNNGVEIIHSGDLPALSGMGSSSSYTVGLSNIIRTIKGKSTDKYSLAYDAIDIEQNKIKEFVGSQDQTFAAFGGVNKIEINKQGKINVLGLNLTDQNLKILQDSSVLVFTGKVRIASLIEEKKIKEIKLNKSKQIEISSLKKLVNECYDILNSTRINISELGSLLNKSWKIKKSLIDDVSNMELDKLYTKALSLGACGGKLLGAGGGGFFYFIVPPSKKKKFKEKIGKKSLDIGIDFEGSKIIFDDSKI